MVILIRCLAEPCTFNNNNTFHNTKFVLQIHLTFNGFYLSDMSATLSTAFTGTVNRLKKHRRQTRLFSNAKFGCSAVA